MIRQTRFLAYSHSSLSDPTGVVESAGANVHIDLNQLLEAPGIWLRRMSTSGWEDCG